MILFKQNLINGSFERHKILYFLKRFVKTSKFKVFDPREKALSHFDDFYKALFAERWPSVRLGLLSKQRNVAVVNNFGDIEETEKFLEREGAFDLKNFIEIQCQSKKLESENAVGSNESVKLEEKENALRKKEDLKDIGEVHPKGAEFLLKSESLRQKKGGRDGSDEGGFEYKSEESRSSLHSDLLVSQIDKSRQIEPDEGVTQMRLEEFVPATLLRGLEEYVPESEYYKYYQVQTEKAIVIEKEFHFDFPEKLKVFTYDRGDITEFPDSTKNVFNINNYVTVEGSDLLTALVLGVQPGDRVLDLCSSSGEMAYCIFQSLRPEVLVCVAGGSRKTSDLFRSCLHDYCPSWRGMLFVTDRLCRDEDADQMFDKVLIHVPSTEDKRSLSEAEDNIFHTESIRRRLRLPELQSSLLLGALRAARPGGTVLYSTATLSPVQNEAVVTSALRTASETHGIEFVVKFAGVGTMGVSQIFTEEEEEEGEFESRSPYPVPVDIDDGVQRDIKISQEIFGTITQYGSEFEVMRFTLENTLAEGIKVQVMSLGAALVGVVAPDRKGVYMDVVQGFDFVHQYYSPLNPGFGRITSLCPLPYNLEKVVWDWDFDRDEGSVTFSTTFYRIDLILSVKYTLNVCNELIVDMKACGSKIVPISLTSQVYWNMAGHYKGEEALRHHVLSINSDRIWKHVNHKLKNFFPVHDTVLDFRQPTMMDSNEIFGDKKFEHVYVVTKGCKQSVSFVARLIHPRTCRYVEIFSDQPWILCNTLNKFPRADWNLDPCPDDDDDDDDEDYGECSEGSSDEDPCASEDEREREAELSKELEEIPGKEGKKYRKYSGFCVTPLSDLTGFDPILRSSTHYCHRLIFKLGIYRRYMKKSQKEEEQEETKGEHEGSVDDIVDIENH